MSDLSKHITTLRRFQRHWLLRQYGDDGQVLAENLAVSAAIDALIQALRASITTDEG